MHAANTIVYPTHFIIFNVPGNPKFVEKQIAAMRKILPANGTGNEHASIIYSMGVGRYWSIAPNGRQ